MVKLHDLDGPPVPRLCEVLLILCEIQSASFASFPGVTSPREMYSSNPASVLNEFK